MASVRRLSAIMFTDMVGSTAAAQANEAEALKLRDEQAALVRPLFAAHQGREIKSMGDGFLAEFDSALHAVQCAIDIQQRLHERNSQSGVPPIRLRIGIHLGDVEQRETDIFGDAVNIAARIEPLASPGGVCISGEVASQIRNKIPNQLGKLPPTPLKGLEALVDVYQVVLPWAVREPPPVSGGPVRLAVLPFINMSPDPRDEYFADGLTEELITILSQLHEVRVIARTSVFPYKATSKSVSQIGTELGVTSILEGSVRKANDQIRITVQLIDVGTQEHAWANTYDRELQDVFGVQTEVAKRIAKTLKIKIKKAEETNLERRPTPRPDSYLEYLKGRSLLTGEWSEENFRGAIKHFKKAIAIDPTNARAYSGLADANLHLGWGHFEPPRGEWTRAASDAATRALELDPQLAEAHCSLALVREDVLDYAGPEGEFKIALSLNPSYAYAHHAYAMFLTELTRTDDALREFTLAVELDPQSVRYADTLHWLLIMLRRLDSAKVELERLRQLDRDGPTYCGALCYYHWANADIPRALEAADRLETLRPGESWKPRIWILATSGEMAKAKELWMKQKDNAQKEAPQDLALLHALLGDLDEAFRLLNKSLDQGEISLHFWRNEPAFAPARMDPRFAELLRRVGIGLPQRC